MSVIITEPIISGIIVIKTSLGEIKIELWSKECPKTCKNLIQLALEGYYDNSIFHRQVVTFPLAFPLSTVTKLLVRLGSSLDSSLKQGHQDLQEMEENVFMMKVYSQMNLINDYHSIEEV